MNSGREESGKCQRGIKRNIARRPHDCALRSNSRFTWLVLIVIAHIRTARAFHSNREICAEDPASLPVRTDKIECKSNAHAPPSFCFFFSSGANPFAILNIKVTRRQLFLFLSRGRREDDAERESFRCTKDDIKMIIFKSKERDAGRARLNLIYH